jgi:hypothetical protein
MICIETEAFYALIEAMVERLTENRNVEYDKWIDDKEAMHLLRISSKTTLQRLRDEGCIRFSQPMKKLILYDRDSILAYLDEYARNTY